MAKKKALITGISGQDGAYLAKFLIAKGYTVIGGERQNASGSMWRLKKLGIENKVKFVPFELLEENNINKVVKDEKFDEIYNLAAQSFVGNSYTSPLLTSNINALGVARILEAIRHFSPKTKLYQASTSELYGMVQETPQRETTPFYPRSPYGVAKLYAYWITVNYRESYGMYACNGILFNHESPRRGETFVTRKITRGLARIDAGLEECLFMGNLDSLRDWGHARDYVEMQWRMLQQDSPEDYVIATGRQESVRRFIELAARELGWGNELNESALVWEGEGLAEFGRRRDTGAVVVRIDPRYFRPAEVETLLGDPTKAREKLGWIPATTLEQLVAEMIDHDREEARKEAYLRNEGFDVVGPRE